MAVAFDAVGSSTGFSSTTASLSWTHTAGAGGSAVLVAIAWGSTSFPPTVNTITYGGTTMTALPSGGQASGGAGSNGGILLYGLTGQASGGNTVQITMSAAPGNEMVANSISFTGAANFAAPVKNSGSSTSATATCTGVQATSVVCGAECHGTNGTVTWTAGTKRADDEVSAGSGASNLSIGTSTGSGSVATTATIPNDVWGMISVEVLAASTAPAVRPAQAQVSRTWSHRWSKFVRPNIPPALQQVAVQAQVATVSASVTGANFGPFVSSITGTGTAGYFTDQFGHPKFLLLEQAWALPSNAGRWNGLGAPSNWQSDIDAYFTARASQGYSAWYGTAWSDNHVDSTALSGGRTWDGVYPIVVNGTPGKITTGSETITLNSTFWTRIDYLFNSAKAHGITCFLNLGMQYDFTGSPNIWFNLSTTQANTFGQLLAARYPLSSFPNVQWFFGDDGSGGQDTFFAQMVSGLATGGDTRTMISTEQLPETNSHVEFDTGAIYITSGFGVSSSVTYNWTYTYDPTYLGVEKGYTESGTTLLPVVYGDGIWYGDNSTSQNVTDYTARRVTWWALASGARGTNVTSGPTTGGDVWQWQSNAVTNLTTDPNGTWITGHIGSVISYFTGLADWHKLVPDTGNVFITAGRGTKSTNDAPGFNAAKYGDTDNYVAGSITPTGTLAVIYSGQHFSITIDQTKLNAGYTATWVDPWNLSTTGTTSGSTYNSTGQGNNSQGNPDWVLVLQAPPATTATAGAATVSVVANAPSTAVTVTAGVAAVAAGAAAATAAEAAAAGVPAVLAVAPAATDAVAVNAGAAVVLAADPGATVSTSSGTTANAGVATVLAIATAAAVAEAAQPPAATVLVAAPASSAAETATAGVAVINATVPAASPAVAAQPPAASIATAAAQPQAAIVVGAGVAVVLAADPGATVNTSGSTNAVAAVAQVLAIAPAPSPAIVVFAGVAAVTAVATAATAGGGKIATAGVATVSSLAMAAASVTATATAQAAVVLAAGVNVPPKFTVGLLTAADRPAATLTAGDST